MQGKEHAYGLFFSLILAFWLWMDFLSLFLSVLCTYFYFGWTGTSFHFVKIILVALLAFSGPVLYRVLFSDIEKRWAIKLLLGLQFFLYALIGSIRHSDFFAWIVVLGVFVSGMTAIALLRRMRAFSQHEAPLCGIMISFMLYLAVRILNGGLLTLFHIKGISAAVLIGLFIIAMALKHPGREAPVRPEKAGMTLQFFAVALGPLVGLCVSLLYNFSLWSAKTPSVHAGIYGLSFFIGTLAGVGASRQLSRRPSGLAILFLTATVGTGFALSTVLYVQYRLLLGLIAHAFGCFGTSVFWYFLTRRYRFISVQKPDALPAVGFEIGFIVFGLALAYFLLRVNLDGFWLTLILSASLIAIPEFRQPITQDNLLAARWSYGVTLILIVPFFLTLFFFKLSADEKVLSKDSSELIVMTTNVRYGWTDDYRYEPGKHLQWLLQQPVDIVGFQEINKGSLYGSFMDLYQFYRQAISGNTRYGDANYGFGNGLFTRLPIKDSRVVGYHSSDMIRRSFLWVLLDFNEREIEVFVTHVSHLPHPNPVRQAQVNELIEWIRKSERPWILMGDFNAQPQEPEIVELLKVSNAIFAKKPELLKELTHGSLAPIKRIDYIFFSDHFELVEQQVLDNLGTTDHRPVYSRLMLVR